MNVKNRTPFAAAPFLLVDAAGQETLLAVVKATWHFDADGTLAVAEEQAAIVCEPRYLGAPGASSLLYDTDLVLAKSGTDCALIGHAWAPNKGATQVDVTFAVGPVRKTARVFGERFWIKCLGWTSKSRPMPFEKIPLVYERAFGGCDTSSPRKDQHEFSQHNPVGRGLVARKTKMKVHGMRLPNIEDPHSLISSPKDRPPAAGFGPVAPHWLPRASYLGTYDEAWRRTRCPLPPLDQDIRFFSSAASELTTSTHLVGNERILVEGASPRGRLRLTMPGVAPRVTVRLSQRSEAVPMRLDGVTVEPDDERVVLTWRGSLVVHGRTHEVSALCIEI